jgi:hypothetical protein
MVTDAKQDGDVMTSRYPIRRRTLLGAGLSAALAGPLIARAAAAAGPGEPYRYPVRPGTAAWQEARSQAELVRACDLPPGLAATMTTDDLLTTVLDYPLLFEVSLFNGVQQGVDAVAGRFNGLAELLRRPDAGPVLFDRYAALDLRVPESAPLFAVGERVFRDQMVELLLAQPPVLRTLSAGRQDNLIRHGLAVYDGKRAYERVYGGSGLEPTSLMLGRALAVREGWDWRQSFFLRTGMASSIDVFADVEACARAHLAEPGRSHKVGAGASLSDVGTTVYTPRGTPVSALVRSPDLTPPEVAYLNESAKTYPTVTVLADATKRYNCHTYAWYSQSISAGVWINSPGDDSFWLDGSFKPWFVPMVRVSGRRWSYAADDHSAIVVDPDQGPTGDTGYLTAKWWMGPRVRHYFTVSPYNRSVINQFSPA